MLRRLAVAVALVLVASVAVAAFVPFPDPQPPIGERRPGGTVVTLGSGQSFKLNPGPNGQCVGVANEDGDLVGAQCSRNDRLVIVVDNDGCQLVALGATCEVR